MDTLSQKLNIWKGILAWMVAGCLLLSVSQAFSQTEEEAPESQDSADSQQVDEEEEAFRRSMELGDQDQQERDPSSSTGYPPPAPVDMEPPDILPPESREHLEQQMRELITDVGRWEPADESQDYPYTPSEAAQSDAQLEADERAEWAKEVQEYHEREKAAAAGSAGGGGGDGDGDGDGGGGSSGGDGSGGGAEGGSYGVGGAEESDETGDQGEFSALDYIKGIGQGDEGDPETSPGGGESGAGTEQGGQTPGDSGGAAAKPADEGTAGTQPGAMPIEGLEQAQGVAGASDDNGDAQGGPTSADEGESTGNGGDPSGEAGSPGQPPGGPGELGSSSSAEARAGETPSSETPSTGTPSIDNPATGNPASETSGPPQTGEPSPPPPGSFLAKLLAIFAGQETGQAPSQEPSQESGTPASDSPESAPQPAGTVSSPPQQVEALPEDDRGELPAPAEQSLEELLASLRVGAVLERPETERPAKEPVGDPSDPGD